VWSPASARTISGFSRVSGCTGTVTDRSAIDTSPGKHTLTVSGTAYSNGYHTVRDTVSYTVTALRVSIGTYKFEVRSVSGTSHGTRPPLVKSFKII
jgi:hypothetical protein